MKIEYVIRQQIKAAHKPIMVEIERSVNRRVTEDYYYSVTKENPNHYFELVKVITDEECLEFRPDKEWRDQHETANV